MISRIPKSFKQVCPGTPVFTLESIMSRLVVAVIASAPAPLFAGEIAGLPANTPPFLDTSLQLSFSNDFLGRGGRSDDFRTQQFIIGGTIDKRWDITVDHSILTLDDDENPGRTDQLSLTLGYRLIDAGSATTLNRLTVGAGIRSYGDFAGERIQNGFHQLVRSGIERLPYTETDKTDGAAWLDAQRYALLDTAGSWHWGYWLRGNALVTSDSQFDGSLGAYAISRGRSVDWWFGLRQDWRTGYDDAVLRETAESEQALAAVIGLRWGPVVFETVQQFDGDGSFGQLRLLAGGFGESRRGAEQSAVQFDAAVTIPDVTAQLTGRWRSTWLNRRGRSWQPSLFVSVGFGEPQYDDDPEVYLRAMHAGIGIEWERRLAAAEGRASLYGSLGLGWRQEKVFGDGDREGEKSGSASDGMLLGGFGIRINAAELLWDYNLRIQLGVSAWAPFNDERVVMAGETYRVMEPTAAVALGLTLGRFAAN